MGHSPFIMEDIPQSSESMKDILDIENIVLFLWPKVLLFVFGILALLLSIFLIIKIFQFLKNRKKKILSLSPLEQSLKRLSKIGINLLINSPQPPLKLRGGKGELCHSVYFELSEILREYLDRAYSFPAMEKSTSEIKELFITNKPIALSNEIIGELVSFFEKADQIKFAGQPSDNEGIKVDMEKIKNIIICLDGLLKKDISKHS